MNHKKFTSIKYEVKEKLIKLYGSKCYYCDKYLSIKELTLDHIYPRSKLKQNVSDKLCVLSCARCNKIKGSKIISIEEFRKQIMGKNYYPFDEIKDKKDFILVKRMKQYEQKKKHKKGEVFFTGKIEYPKNPIIKKRNIFYVCYTKAVGIISFVFSSFTLLTKRGETRKNM